MNHRIFLIFSSVLFICEAAIAKKSSTHHQWKEVIPEITKGFLPEESQETIEKIFPPHDKLKNKGKNDKTQSYTGEKKLKGSLSTPIHIHGEGILKSVETSEKIEIEKSAVIENSKIAQLVTHGPLEAKESSIQNLITFGPTTLKECLILQKATINNNLTAKKTTFYGPLKITDSSVTLKSSECQDINLSSPSTQKIILEDTKVKGKIVFEGKAGEIIIKGNSHIHGKIKNGTIRTE